jgi:predicted acyltransferase (DUF342 family)
MWLTLLIFITATLFILPFLPSYLEWKYPTDDKPLDTNANDFSILEFNKRTFEVFIHQNFGQYLTQYSAEQASYEGKLRSGIPFIVTGKSGEIDLDQAELDEKKCNRIIVACQDISLPNKIVFFSKIYGQKNVVSGKENTINDIYIEKNLLLKKGAIIKRSAYCGESITVNRHCSLLGYITAKKNIIFNDDAFFQCLKATRISFGDVSATLKREISRDFVDLDIFADTFKRKVIEKNTVIAEGSKKSKHYVVKGRLRINRNCQIHGNIKAYDTIHIGENTQIIGSVVSEKNIYIDDNCLIRGPIVTYGSLFIGKNCIIGAEQMPASTIAHQIKIRNGAVVYGLLLAKVKGVFAL